MRLASLSAVFQGNAADQSAWAAHALGPARPEAAVHGWLEQGGAVMHVRPTRVSADSETHFVQAAPVIGKAGGTHDRR
jgi:hypothetical protein